MDVIAKFIKSRKAFNISRIAKDCKIPKRTFLHNLKYNVPIPKKYELVLEAYLSKYGYDRFKQRKGQTLKKVNPLHDFTMINGLFKVNESGELLKREEGIWRPYNPWDELLKDTKFVIYIKY